jgi:hypothetical protein
MRAPIAFMCFVTVCVFAVAIAAAETSDTSGVGRSEPEWNVTVIITNPSTGENVDTLRLADAPNHARVFASKDECAAFEETDEFKATLPGLAAFIAAHGWEKNVVSIQCAPAPKSESF